MPDTLKRRSRFTRQPSRKTLRLNSRDVDIFQWLYRYRYLNSAQLAQFIRPKSHKRFIERLGSLYHDGGYINRPKQQTRNVNARYAPAIYELTQSGYEVLVKEAELPNKAVPFGGMQRKVNHQFDHAFQISSVVSQIELAMQKSNSESFVDQDTIYEKASQKLRRDVRSPVLHYRLLSRDHKIVPATGYKSHAIPDALFAICNEEHSKKLYRFYAVEIENKNPIFRRSLEKPSFIKKLLAYRAILKSRTFETTLSLPNLFVIFTCSCPKHFTSMITLAKELLSEEERKFELLQPMDKLEQFLLMKTDSATS